MNKLTKGIIATVIVAGLIGGVGHHLVPAKENINVALDRIEDNNIAVIELSYGDTIETANVPLYDYMLDMTTVVDYESTEEGLLLKTYDGNGYFLEIHK